MVVSVSLHYHWMCANISTTRCVAVWKCFTVALLIFVPALCDVEFSAVGSYRATMTGDVVVKQVRAANLGHCCMLCANELSCIIVDYMPSTKLCQLLDSVAMNGTTWSADPMWLKLVKADMIDDASTVTTQMQPVAGVLVQSGRAEGYTAYTLQKIVNAAHCLRLCMALTGGLCRLFAHHASQLTCYVYDVDFYSTWTSVESDDSGWTSYYAKQTNGWKLLYKVSKGIGVDVSNTFLVGPTNCTGSSMQTAMNANCSCYIRNAIIDNWSKFPITSVSLVLATGDAAMKRVNFSATSSDNSSTFFIASKILYSSWTDLNSATVPYRMKLGTPTDNTFGRYFVMVKDVFSGCSSDTGWLSVNGPGIYPCSYDVNPAPQFVYASGNTASPFASSDATFADALLIYAKM